MRRVLGLIILFLFVGIGSINAQNVLFFSSKQGLSNSRVRNIMEDSRHNIWLTTQNGLNRYDGVKMNVYRHEIGNPASLLHDESTCVYEYAKNKILVGTGAGVQMYDYATDKFTYIPFILDNGDTISTRTVSICRIRKNRILVCFAGYGQGELQEDKGGHLYLRYCAEFETDEPTTNATQLMEDTEGNIWVVNSRHNLFRQTGKRFRKYSELMDVRKVSMSTSGMVYVATYNQGLYVYCEKEDCFERVADAAAMGGTVTELNPWTACRMLICTDGGGLRVYDERTGKVTQSSISVKGLDTTTSNVSDAICDSFGNVWVGVYMKGVMMKPMSPSVFEYIGPNSMTKNTIGSSSIVALCEVLRPTIDKQGMWIAADNDGLYRMSVDGRTSVHWSKETNPEMPRAFTTMMNIDSSTLVLGTFSEGLWQMKEGRFSLLTKEINQIFEIRQAAEKGCFWIATIGDGLFYYQLSTGKLLNYRPNYREKDGARILNNSYIYTVLPVGKKLFVGTADGLAVCYPEKDGVIKKASTKLLDELTVRHLAVSADKSVVWVATNAGLAKINAKTLETRIYTKKEGLPINGLTSVLEEGNKLWIGTDYGLSCMDIQEEKFINFFSEDGLQDNEFNRGAVAILNGHIYMGGIGGVTYFNAKRMRQWQGEIRSLHLRLVDVWLWGRAVHQGEWSSHFEILKGLLDECERIDLCHADNHFALELCVDGLSNQHVSYQYSVNDGPWMDQGGNSSRIIFDNLDPDTYHIKVRARALGTMSDVRQLTVVIHPAWYASFWAWMVYFAILCALGWLIYEYTKRQIRLRRIMGRNRQQQELNEARLQFFMNISHEIRTPMTLILAPLERLIGMDKDEERQRNYHLIKQNSKRILRLINQMMEVRKIEEGKFLLDYHQLELVSFLQNIYDVFVTNAQNRDIHYEFVHDVDRLQVYVDPENMDKIVMNLLSNAFKFTPDGGKITLQLNCKGEEFELMVIDSGAGIRDEVKSRIFERFYSAQYQNGYMGTGIGLNLTSMLVKLHQGSIKLEDNPEGQGTLFRVTMPIGEVPQEMTNPSGNEVAVEDTASSDVMDEMADLLAIDKPLDTHHRNAVLVEDDEEIRQYVHSELSNDLVVYPCGNGQEAWDYIVAHPGRVDIVISDIMMPVMDGMTLCQKLKANFNTNHIPVVLMTALTSDADRIAGLTNGADAYISKPFNIDVLRSTVIQLLKTRQVLQGKYHGDKQQEEKIDHVEMESPDEHLMRRVMKAINENMDNSDLSVEMIADQVGISRVHFYRKMKDLTGQAPRDFVKYVRLKEAARMLSEKRLDITGVSIATGFKSLSAFSTSFKALYGVSPTDWVKQQENEG